MFATSSRSGTYAIARDWSATITAGERKAQSPTTFPSAGVRCGTHTTVGAAIGCLCFHSPGTPLPKPGASTPPPAAPPLFGRNLAAVLAWELLWGFGNACTTSPIFVPFLSKLEDGSKRLVGTVGAPTLLGTPALFVSLWPRHRLRRRRLAVALLFAAQVVGWIVLGAALLSGATLSSSIV